MVTMTRRGRPVGDCQDKYRKSGRGISWINSLLEVLGASMTSGGSESFHQNRGLGYDDNGRRVG